MNVSDLKKGYHQFGNKGAVWSNCTHIVRTGFESTTLCGTPMLSHNWAANEMHETIGCPKCLEIYNEETKTPEPVVKTEKEKLIETLEYMNENQCKEIRKFIHLVSQSNLNKGELMKFAYGKHYTGIDTALPRDLVVEVQDLISNFTTQFHCMNYNNPSNFGLVENIAEQVLVKLMEAFKS